MRSSGSLRHLYDDSGNALSSARGRNSQVSASTARLRAKLSRAGATSPPCRPKMTATETWRIRHAKLRRLAHSRPGADRDHERDRARHRSTGARNRRAHHRSPRCSSRSSRTFPGREVMVITLDIPPGGGSAPHRHPGHHVFGYVLEGSYKLKLDQGDGENPDQGPDVLRGAGPVARRLRQCQRDRARQGARRHRGRERQAGHRAGEAVA